MDKIFKAMRNLIYWFSVIAMSVMLAITFFSVISRYLLGFTFGWSEELARFLFVWTVFLGGALIMGESGHLAVELVTTKLKGRGLGAVLAVFIKLCSYAFVLILMKEGWTMTTRMMFQTSPGLGVPMGVVYSVIPLSSILMLIYLIKDTIGFARTTFGQAATGGSGGPSAGERK
ncbi:MAG: TRAP transporter small permease [Spirochaetaceae bacterium]|nr:TRAP transporter small permease [Spirochaetaceae bacterium]